MISEKEFTEVIYSIIGALSVKSNTAQDYDLGVPLYTSEVHMIVNIGRTEGIRAVDLAEQLGITKGAVSQTLKKLEEKSLVKREQKLLVLTESGRKVFEQHEERYSKKVKAFYDYVLSLPESNRDAVVDSIKKFRELEGN